MPFVAMQMSYRLGLVSSDGQREHPVWYPRSPEQHYLVAPIRAPAIMGSSYLRACLRPLWWIVPGMASLARCQSGVQLTNLNAI